MTFDFPGTRHLSLLSNRALFIDVRGLGGGVGADEAIWEGKFF